jgi:vacuolar-type H+-ATPase subunit I/STV1
MTAPETLWAQALPRHHEPLSRLGQFSWGLAGAVFPPMIRAFNSVYPGAEIPHLGWAFILLSLGVFVGGGLWSQAMGSEKPWKALYNGATFPLVFGYLAHVTVPSH